MSEELAPLNDSVNPVWLLHGTNGPGRSSRGARAPVGIICLIPRVHLHPGSSEPKIKQISRGQLSLWKVSGYCQKAAVPRHAGGIFTPALNGQTKYWPMGTLHVKNSKSSLGEFTEITQLNVQLVCRAVKAGYFIHSFILSICCHFSLGSPEERTKKVTEVTKN